MAILWVPCFYLMSLVGKAVSAAPTRVVPDRNDLIGGFQRRPIRDAHPYDADNNYEMIFDTHDDGGGDD